jgi:acetylornithine deacetylase/succinyl-diaminopimelate desuccinylase-like protein
VKSVAGKRHLQASIEPLQSLGVTACSEPLMRQMDRAVAAQGLRVRRLPSGAGHDGMALKAITDIAMLFVRCRDGVSHNPAESITRADAEIAARALLHFIEHFEPHA